MDTLDYERPSGTTDRRLHVIAGQITEIGDDYLILGSTTPISLIDGLAATYHAGQVDTVTAALFDDGTFVAQKIELAQR